MTKVQATNLMNAVRRAGANCSNPSSSSMRRSGLHRLAVVRSRRARSLALRKPPSGFWVHPCTSEAALLRRRRGSGR